jgi:hypothetical protein
MSDESPPPRRKPSSDDRSAGGNGAPKRPAASQSRESDSRSRTGDRESAPRRPERSGEPDSQRSGGRDSQRSGEPDSQRSGEPDSGQPSRPAPEKRKLSPAKAARAAIEQFVDLSEHEPEWIIGIERSDDGGWRVRLEVVESRRIPDTSDILGEYEMVVDEEGELVSYSRRSRYARGRIRDE